MTDDPMAKRKHEDTTLAPLTTSFEDAVKALLRTPPPPAGHPATEADGDHGKGRHAPSP